MDNKKRIKTIKKIYPQIYSYILPDLQDHNGWQKIGYTERRDVDERIREQTQTAAIKLRYSKLWSASSVFASNKLKFFTDKDLHKYYIKNEVPQSQKQDNGGLGEEWFYFNGTPEKSKELFDAYILNDYTGFRAAEKTYTLRDEQKRAVLKTLEYAKDHITTDFSSPNPKAKYLWNAKPRFGKTLTSYDFAKRFGAKNILIVTNRPAIANSWFDDYDRFIDGYYFISTADSLKDRKVLTRGEFLNRNNPSNNDGQITFLSLQDLKGAKVFGGGYNKLEWVADLNWDLLIIDEAHEGIDTERTNMAFDKIKRRFTLHLSGTPFKAIADGQFSKNQIFNWTYIDEQRVKGSEIRNGNDSGDHINLPDLRLFTYKMSDVIASRLSDGVDLEEENFDYAFELNEMFSTDQNGNFYHEQEILTFLDQLTSNEKYPFSTPELRNELKRTFWLVGNRVASAKAMEKLLRNHPIFKEYRIILAAGNGESSSNNDTSEMEMQNTKANEKAYYRVKQAVQNYDKTITLSVGQLTTGVTIEEWAAVLMLSDIKSEALYMQAIFRSQNPYKFTDENGEIYRKKSAYVFDFSPARVLRVYDKFANSLLADVVNGEATDSQRKQNVAELLNYFPVLAEDKYGRMVELNAEQVLTYPKAIIAKEVVNRGFVTNLLFININNVFNIPTEIINSLNKAQSTNDTGKQISKTEEVQHDSSRAAKRDHRISVNKEKLLGNKIYGLKMREIVSTAAEYTPKEELANKIIEKYKEQIEEPLAVYREIYSPSKAELEELKNEQIEKVKLITDEFVSKDLSIEKNQVDLANKLSEIIENELPNDLVTHKEEEIYENEEETEMDQIRKKLRTFTRAIPSFIMASKNPNAITLDNIEETVSDEDFEQLFTEKDSKEPFTKDDFCKIRGPWTNPETGETFEGFFDRYTFNAAIKEFEEKRQELADYLRPGIIEDIFSYIRPLKTNQIFTPRRIVNKMLDLFEDENPGIYENPDITFADLYVKSGLYLTELAKRLNRGLESKIPDRIERMKHIFEHQLYGFAPTEIIYNIARKYIYGNFTGISSDNFKQRDLTDDFKKGNTLGMRFDVVVGNPPYQDETVGDNKTFAPQIYHKFIDASYKIADRVILIHPARFLFNAGSTPKEWNERMLSDKHVKIIQYYPLSKEVFTNTDIKGGIAVSYRDIGTNFGAIEVFTSFNELNSILKKTVRRSDFKSLSEITASRTAYRLSKKMHEDYPDAINNLSAGHAYDMSSNIFTALPFIFFEEKPDDGHEYIQMLGRLNNQRTYRFIRRDYIVETPNFSKYKVIIAGANGSGAIGETLSTPLIGTPLIGTTESFISIGSFETEEEAKYCEKYVKTKFARTLLGILKVTQAITPGKWKYVPLQDFTNNSDIDWSKSVAEIDKQLYTKYGLSQEEIDFIEEKVKAME